MRKTVQTFSYYPSSSVLTQFPSQTGVLFPGAAFCARFMKSRGGAAWFKAHLALVFIGTLTVFAAYGVGEQHVHKRMHYFPGVRECVKHHGKST